MLNDMVIKIIDSYYETNVWVDNECVYTIGDLHEYLNEAVEDVKKVSIDFINSITEELVDLIMNDEDNENYSCDNIKTYINEENITCLYNALSEYIMNYLNIEDDKKYEYSIFIEKNLSTGIIKISPNFQMEFIEDGELKDAEKYKFRSERQLFDIINTFYPFHIPYSRLKYKKSLADNNILYAYI